MPERLVYKYSLYDYKTEIAVWEREPSRMLEILDPSDYASYKRTHMAIK